MSILAWVILGFIADAIAKMLCPGTQRDGFFSNIILGIISGVIGSSIMTLL